ncbi:lipid A biosynthesis acyltransferase [Ornithinimicrobium pekingense]|uniref:Lipid A biosynthesis lauroyl acyltransferase n=1 Tax=Ornithinimicrobium pekingense TaxID=384677 RepID=A0ABQ2FAX0_9MICO|nr:lipid A biosynthesis acyltransferase [Ornithinimicrobium pekingense]GGK76418.1 lipid A biosynthesis lauroyl acyltransferase [Ornithinimicrobium pekingense]
MSLRQLHRNYGAVRPELGRAAHLAVSARGTLSYAAYWARLASLPFLSRRQVDAMVHAKGLEDVLEGMRQGRGQVFVLLHQGHWELAGAWAAHRLGGLATVAEVLPPRRVMTRVTSRGRAAAGLDVVPATGGAGRRLVEVLRGGGAVALLADRDLSDRGVHHRRVPVQLAGVRTTLAAGPAELALATGAELRPVSVVTGGRRGPRHRVTFGRPCVGGPGSREERVAALMQECADVLGESVRRHTSDWHLTAPLERGAG